MKLHTLKCPGCDASLEIDNGIDTFYCKYCGYKIMLENQSDVSINAKVKMKSMEHKERLKDKQYDQERYKMKFKQKYERYNMIFYCGILGAIILMCFIMGIFGGVTAKKQEEKLQAIVDEIIIDIENEDFDTAYIKANSLYWDASWTSEGEDKWDATRKAVIKKIKEAKKKSSEKSSSNNDNIEKDDESGVFLIGLNSIMLILKMQQEIVFLHE